MSKKLKFVNGQMVEYEIFKLVDRYDDILREPTKEVDFNDPNVNVPHLAFSLAETLGELNGLGLSANQVGLPYRMMAVNMGEKIWIMINPKVISRSTDRTEYNEGCLSFPGLFLKIGRPESVVVEFQAIGGEKLTQEFNGLTATVVQHELDHLDGIVFTDLVSPIKLDIAKRKVKSNIRKLKRLTGT
jgi:peptide deformylase